MSPRLISRNADLQALRDEGYEVVIQADHLVLRNVPYVTANREVKRGSLISVLELSGDETRKPADHKAWFSGEHPCDKNGNRLEHLAHSSQHKKLGDGLSADHMFSSKPAEGYRDYQHKMQTYVEMVSAPARALDPNATARTFIVEPPSEGGAVFNYIDTASTRAEIAAITAKLALNRVAIIGLGGTGSYVLDQVAKLPIREVHLFDGDTFLQHNVFRSPGAPSIEVLRRAPKKVDYWAALYAPMRKGIVPHAVAIDEGTMNLLDGMDFVFVCIHGGKAKQAIFKKLESDGVAFVDVGMGLWVAEDKLGGTVRVTASTPEMRDHIGRHVSFAGDGDGDVYAQNIQVADLNMLNAALAVIKFKKIFGFYADPDREHQSHYMVDGNAMLNSECAA